MLAGIVREAAEAEVDAVAVARAKAVEGAEREALLDVLDSIHGEST